LARKGKREASALPLGETVAAVVVAVVGLDVNRGDDVELGGDEPRACR
jgi:hypothetical protein